MSEIRKYKMALRHLTNPRYMTRDFIVPLYTGTEPDPETEVQPDMVVPPQDVLPKGAEPVMPFFNGTVPNSQDRILELAEGGRIGFELGGGKFKDTSKKHSFIKTGRGQTDFEGIIKEIDNIVLRSNADPFSSLTPNQVIQEIGYRDSSSMRNKELKNKYISIKKNLIPLDQKFKNYALDLLNNLDTLPFDEIVKSKGFANFFEEKFNTRMIGTKLKKVYNSPELKDLREIIKTLSHGSILNAYNNKGKTVEEVLSNLDFRKSSGIPYIKSIPGRILNVAERSVNQGNKDIRLITRGENKELLDPRNIMFEWNKKLYGINPDIETYRGKKVNNLTTDLYKLPEFDEYLNSLNKLEETKNKIVQHPVNQKPVTLNKLLQETYSTGKEGKNSYGKSALELDHVNIKDNPFSNLRVLPRHINQTAGLIGKDISIIENKDKALKAIGYNIPEEALENSILKFSDRVLNKGIPMNQTYEVALRDLTGASKEYLSPESKITTEGLKEGKVGTEEFFKKQSQVMTSSGPREVSPKERIDKAFNEWKKGLLEELSEDTKNQVIGIAGGCPSEYANGGRVKFGKGSNCYINGLKNIEEGNLNKTKLNQIEKTILESNEMSSMTKRSINVAKNAFNIAKGAGNIMEAFLSVGPGKLGLGLGLGVEGLFAYPELSRGDWREALRNFFPIQIAQTIGVPTGLNESRYDDIVDVAKDAGADVNKVKKFAEFGKNIEKEENLYKELEALQKAYKNPNDPDFIEQSKRFETKFKELNDYFNNNRFSSTELTEFGKEFSKASNYFAKKNIENIIPKDRSKEALLESQRRNLDVPFENVFGQSKEKMFDIIGLPKPSELPPPQEPTIEDVQAIEEMGARGGAAEGGRIGFDKGGMSRRGFLGLLTGAAAAPELIKAVKGGKTATQVASKLKFEKAKGMYPWFPDLVEKIKVKGKPFEEKDLIMEASYKHQAKEYGGLPKGVEKLTKHVDGDTEFILREYPDGRIAVDIHSPRNQEGLDTPVTLYYRPTMELDYYNGKKVVPAEFKVLEKEPRYFANGPDDVDIEMTEKVKVPGKTPIYGDIEAAERFATGDIKNRKIIPAKQSRRNQMSDEPVNFIDETQPYGYDPYASGGRVGFASGKSLEFLKMLRNISNSIYELKQSTHMLGYTSRTKGIEKATEEALTPYRGGKNSNQQVTILTKIDNAKEHLPREYHATLDEMTKFAENHQYDKVEDMAKALDKVIDPNLKFENLPKDMFPMTDPLNDAFIIIDPEKGHMIGRYTLRTKVNQETGRGTHETFDIWDPENRRFYKEGEEKLKGVESIEKGKKGLN